MARASILVVAGAVAAVAASQAPPQPPRFRVAVDIVAIDAVVTDREGNVVRDLTAADFEVFQNGRRQKVTFTEFVPVMTGLAAPAEHTVPEASASPAVPGASAGPAPPPARGRVQRTFVIVVDDLGLSFEGIDNVRRGLRHFVETGLLPTDLVAIVRTGEARGLLQALTSDRTVLGAAIDALPYNVQSRKGVSPSDDVIQVGDAPPTINAVSPLQRSVSAGGSLAALNLVVQAARDLPGRKTVIVASEGFQLWEDTAAGRTPEEDTRVRPAVDRVIDQATRAGVVIYAVDGRALEPTGLRAADDIHSVDPRFNPDAAGAVLRGLATDRQRSSRDAQETLAYLAEQTGGFAVLNTNDLGRGLNRIGNDVRDYYVIGYEPDGNTFVPRGKTPRLHKITVSVRRPDVRVRTRKEFIGVSDPARPSAPSTPAQLLVRAAISPFSVTAIAMNATSYLGYSRERGTFVRSVLHLDARALAFVTDASGRKIASADLVGLVYDSDGAQVDTITTGFDVTLENAAAEQTIRSGLVYTTRVPMPKPGGYQLRYAVRDRRSGAVGAVGGFVNIPDVKNGAFALSGLVLRAGDHSAPTELLESDRFSVPAADALRVYPPGARLSYSYEIYNAGTSIRVAASLWRGTDRVTSLPTETLTPPASGDLFAASGGLVLDNQLPAGTYVLEIAAASTDPSRAGKARTAVQRLSFDVR